VSFDSTGFGEGRHEATEHHLEGLRLEQAEHTTERVAARNAMLKAQKKPQQIFLRLPKVRHV